MCARSVSYTQWQYPFDLERAQFPHAKFIDPPDKKVGMREGQGVSGLCLRLGFAFLLYSLALSFSHFLFEKPRKKHRADASAALSPPPSAGPRGALSGSVLLEKEVGARRVRTCVCVCVCTSVRVHACVCVHVCVS